MSSASTNVKTASLYGSLHIRQRVAIVWEEVFTASNKVISQSKKFDFLIMKGIPDPNIHTMLGKLQIFTGFMDKIIENAGILNVEHDEIKSILNAREQLRKLERVATALIDDNEDDYNFWIAALEKQAVF
jgi:hypothetical protein